MTTVKDLFENEKLMNNIVEDLDYFPEDTEVIYAVWALGYDKDDEPTDAEYLIGEFENLDEAIACAENFTLETFNAEYQKPYPDTVYLSIEVETVVSDPYDEDGCTMNLGNLYHRELWLNDEAAEDAAGLGDYHNVVCIAAKDFELLEDGTLKVSCALLMDFNKNDYVVFEFVDEPDVSLLTYKVMSKVIYEDGEYYHCELMI